MCSALKSKFLNKKNKHKLFSVLLHCQRLLSLQADHASGFHIRSVLCVPIWNRTHQIIGKLPRDNQLVLTGKLVFVLQIDNDGFVVSTGVAQILNRLDRKTFNDADQRLFEVSFFENSDYSCSIKTLSSLLHWINLIPNLLSCVCFFFFVCRHL